MQWSGVVHGMSTGMEDPRMGYLQDGVLVHVCSVVCHCATAAYSMEHVVECGSMCRGWYRMMHPDHEMKKTLGVGIPGSMDPGIIHLGVDACTVEWSVAIAGDCSTCMPAVQSTQQSIAYVVHKKSNSTTHHSASGWWMLDA